MWLVLAQTAQKAGGLFGMFLPMILVFVVFYFLLIRPQQKQAKKQQQMIAGVRVGDEVITRSGFHGRITAVDAMTCMIEIANNMRVKMNKDQIALVKGQEVQPQKATA